MRLLPSLFRLGRSTRDAALADRSYAARNSNRWFVLAGGGLLVLWRVLRTPQHRDAGAPSAQGANDRPPDVMPAQEDIIGQQRILQAHRRRLADLLIQRATSGEVNATPGVIGDIRGTRAEIRRVKAILRGWAVSVADHPDDDTWEPRTASDGGHTQEAIAIQDDLLQAHRRRLADLLKQKATTGDANAALDVLDGIRSARSQIRRIKQILREWGMVVTDHPDDGGELPYGLGAGGLLPDQETITIQIDLLQAHRRRLADLLRQKATTGDANVAPGVLDGIRHARAEIKHMKGILRGWGVAMDDHPDDEEWQPNGRTGGGQGFDQDAIVGQQRILQAYRRRLVDLLEQQAMLGETNVPPGITSGITTARARIRRVKTILRGWNVVVEDWPDDEEEERSSTTTDSG